ncbi:MBL fold metallo-hydrolase [Rhodococcus sp. WB9]|uniref:MBL fold metallo-hydrolase n=1 Tax=Rhodococcus sp. WB9 TaxID=2594007 RepID=UPI001185B647|nr:MBL fold metallo-hydrolase [Rhodococcus sp. WB9]
MLEGADSLLVIDPGWVGPETEQAMSAALRQLGHRLDDITVCLATHHHGDHYSQAFAWRTTPGCALFAGREERRSIDSFLTDVGRFPIIRRCSHGAGQRDSLSVSHEMGKPGKGPISPTADRTAGSTTVT